VTARVIRLSGGGVPAVVNTQRCNDATYASFLRRIAGKPATLVFGFDQRAPFANILVRKQDNDSGKIRSVKDLADKTVAMTQPQSATWLMATYIADRNGVKDKVTVRGLGDFATMLAAVKSGQVDAAVATISMIDSAKQQGWGYALFDVTDEKTWLKLFGGPVPGVLPSRKARDASRALSRRS
jgi:NitT/TauT family transport system substrate-binding protein